MLSSQNSGLRLEASITLLSMVIPSGAAIVWGRALE
jgi:hypothetical protein